MKAFISFKEIEQIIRLKTGKEIQLSNTDMPETVRIEYPVTLKIPLLGTRTKMIGGNVTLNRLSGLDLDISYTLFKGVDIVLDLVTKMIDKYMVQTNYVSPGLQKNNLILHCDRILRKAGLKNVDNLEEHIRPEALHVRDKGFELEFSVKL